jgi:hypothetical protein
MLRSLPVLCATLFLIAACTVKDDDSSKQKLDPCSNDSECAEADARCIEVSGSKRCTGSLSNPTAFQTDCTLDTASNCAGLLCLTLKPNEQDKAGICTLGCDGDGDCPGGACLDATKTLGAKLCLRSCGTNADCSNGFVCILDAPSQRKFCLVKPK